jgi:hypothetical protein
MTEDAINYDADAAPHRNHGRCERKPQPTKTVWAIGSMEWLAEQENACL